VRKIVNLVALVAVLAGVVFTAASAAASGPVPEQSAANFEVKFMTRMIDHHAVCFRSLNSLPDTQQRR
jgi:uncharacterized protein (DUF305 family)